MLILPVELIMTKKTTRLSDATIIRIPLYLRALQELKEQDGYIISSSDLANLVGVQPAQLRKDLSYLGEFGTRGVGYDISHLKNQLSNRPYEKVVNSFDRCRKVGSGIDTLSGVQEARP